MAIRRRDNRRHTAVHEAGHAVVGRVLGLDCGPVSIELNRADREAGHAIIADPSVTLSRWDRNGRFRGDPERSVFRGRIMAMMAGAEAEIALLGFCNGGDGDDRFQIAAMIDSMEALDLIGEERRELRLRRATCQIVRSHIGKIERLALALLAYGLLVEEDVIRGLAGLPPAPVEVDFWAMQMEGVEIINAASIIAASVEPNSFGAW